jgi:hypothetical protein
MNKNPPAPESEAQSSKGIGFIWFFTRWSFNRLLHSASAGFVLTALLVYLSSRRGDTGQQGLALLQQFIDHSVPNKSLYLVALGFLGLSAAFSRSLLAEITRKWIAKPLVELSSHALSVAIGVVLGLAASATYVNDLRAGVPDLLKAALVSVSVFFILQIALLVARGRCDKLFQSHRAIEFTVAVAGVCIAVAAIQDMNVELAHATQHNVKCSDEPTASAESMKSELPRRR